MTGIDALSRLLIDYQAFVPDLPDEWFRVDPLVARDPDFVSLSNSSIREIERTRTWFDVKIMRQYLTLVATGGSRARDITNLIAINTRRIGIEAGTSRPPLADLCIRCFNSYLRATINSNDQRTCYYIMNQYRQLAEHLIKSGQQDAVRDIAEHFRFYGHLGFNLGMPFLLEVVAYDVVQLVKYCAREESTLVDELLKLVLELDRDVKKKSEEESLLGVRRAQLLLAIFFLDLGDTERARRVTRDLMMEKPERLERVRSVLMSEESPHYWEVTDRGVNFSYLDPTLRCHLDTIFSWINEP